MAVDLEVYVQDMVARKLVHEVHTSERRSFRGCRRRWDWIFRDNYYPPLTAKPLEFGVAFHKAMETLHNPETWGWNHMVLGALAEKTFVEECLAQKKAYLAAKSLYCLEDDQEHDYEERIELGRGMLQYYVNNKLPEIQAEYTPVYVEASFDLPMKDENGKPLFCKCSRCRKDFAKAGGGRWLGNPVVFSGRLDVLVADNTGGYWIWDWKTTAQFGDIEEYLELDDQVASYCMALARLGYNIRGFIYFELRKGFPEPPKANKTVRLGRKFSVGKNQTTDYETYKATVEEKDKEAYEAGLYDDFLNWLQVQEEHKSLFFRKFKIYKSYTQLDSIEANLRSEVLDMLDPNLRIYPMAGRFSCSWCAFKTPCTMKDSGQDYLYTLDTMFVKMEPYYRRTQDKPSTESKGAE